MLLGLVAFAIVLLIAALVLSTHKSSEVTQRNHDTPSQDSAGLSTAPYDGMFAGFKINPPADWIIDRKIPTIHVSFINPKPDSDATGPFKANLNVATQVANGVSLDQFIAITKKTQLSTLTNYKEVIDRPISVGGVRGHIIEATFLNDNRELHIAQLIALNNNNAYIVTGTTLDATWSKYQSLFDASQMSLRLSTVK